MPVAVFGHLRLTLIPAGAPTSEGRVVFDDRNLIVNIGMQVFSRMLGGGAGSPTIGGGAIGTIDDIAVAGMRLGKSTSAPAPAYGDTVGITDPVTFVPTLTVSYPTDTSVRFIGIVPALEEDGTTFTEEALYLKNGMLFAKRLISPGVLKPSGLALQIDHTLNFVRA